MGINEGMRLLRVICLLPLLGLNSCTYLLGKAAKMGMFDKKLPKNNRTGEAKLIGTIELVNPEQNYVLINCEQRLNIPAGTEIVSQNADGTKAKLKVTPERKGNYITADIRKACPRCGIWCFIRSNRGICRRQRRARQERSRARQCR
jgi:hypothetical protein